MVAAILDIPKNYADGEALFEQDLDDISTAVEEWGLKTVRNIEQIAKDVFGTSYNLDNDGLSNLSPTLYDVNTSISGVSWTYTGTMVFNTNITVNKTVVDATVAIDITNDGTGACIQSDSTSTGDHILLQDDGDACFKVKETGLMEYGGANSVGWINNLGLVLAGGTFSVVDAGGAALTSTNPGWIWVPSTTAGQNVCVKVAASNSIADASGSSDMTGYEWGITSGVDWAEDKPFYLYICNRANSNVDGADGSSAFFIASNPAMTTTPSAANSIGDTDAVPVTDDKDGIIFMQSVTQANYTSLPCQCVGAFRMQYDGGTTDWTIQSLSQSDGVGRFHEETRFTMPAGQMGSASGKYIDDNGGTAPAFSTNDLTYTIDRKGNCTMYVYMTGDGGDDGSGAGSVLVSMPYKHSYSNTTPSGPILASTPTENYIGYAAIIAGNSAFSIVRHTDSGGAIQSVITTVDLAFFSNGGRDIQGTVHYKAF